MPCSSIVHLKIDVIAGSVDAPFTPLRIPAPLSTSLFPVSRLLEKEGGIAECLMMETMMDCALSADKVVKNKKLPEFICIRDFWVAWRRVAAVVEWYSCTRGRVINMTERR